VILALPVVIVLTRVLDKNSVPTGLPANDMPYVGGAAGVVALPKFVRIFSVSNLPNFINE